MELILWRHAEAEEGFPDMARQLTGKGLTKQDAWRIGLNQNYRKKRG